MKKEKSFPQAVSYRMQFACFDCRKAFKHEIDAREPSRTEPVCPQCGTKMWEMGRTFKAPRQSDLKQWNKVEALVRNDITFHSYGSHGLGRFPKVLREVEPFVERVKNKSKGGKLLTRVKKRKAVKGQRAHAKRAV